AAEAEAACKRLLGKLPDTGALLLRIGDAQLAQQKFADAAKSFAAAAEHRPNSCEALYKQGLALVAAHRKRDAIKAFHALEALHSDDPAHAVYREKARETLAKLLPRPGAELPLPAIHPSGCPLSLDSPLFGNDLAAKLSASVGTLREDSPQMPFLVSELPQRRRDGVKI